MTWQESLGDLLSRLQRLGISSEALKVREMRIVEAIESKSYNGPYDMAFLWSDLATVLGLQGKYENERDALRQAIGLNHPMSYAISLRLANSYFPYQFPDDWIHAVEAANMCGLTHPSAVADLIRLIEDLIASVKPDDVNAINNAEFQRLAGRLQELARHHKVDWSLSAAVEKSPQRTDVHELFGLKR